MPPEHLRRSWTLGVCALSAGIGFHGVTLTILMIGYLSDQVMGLSVRWLIVQGTAVGSYSLMLGAWLRYRMRMAQYRVLERILSVLVVLLIPTVAVIYAFCDF